jgi:hypothetical protein
MAEEEKGFVIKDRRSLDEKGDLKEQESEKKPPRPKEEEKKAERTTEDEAQRVPLPEVSFNTLIFSLSSSALLHLGEIQDPYTGQSKTDLPLAKHTIDLIAMLKAKTKGNLSDEEYKFIESVLADLRWRYVKASDKV